MTPRDIKGELLQVVETLPPLKQVEVLDFARFLRQERAAGQSEEKRQPSRIELRVIPATILCDLSGLVAWGGNAVADTEALYDRDRCH